jgi:hypothetical protein
MDKQPQNTFRRLMIVASTDRKPKPQPQPSGAWWWDPEPLHRPTPAQATPAASEPIRMAVMPAPSRGQAWFAALTSIWKFLRANFAGEQTEQRGAAVLSFRRYQRFAARARDVRRVAAEECVASKKPNGSVPWTDYGATARQEGGRG